MKKFNKNSTIIILLAVLLVGLSGSQPTMANSTPPLGAAASYGILANTFTNSGGATVNGDVGFLVPPTTEPNPVGGHTNYGSNPPYAAAGVDQASAVTVLSGHICTFTWPGAVDLFLDATHGVAGIYTPGVYCSNGAMSMSGPIILNGSGTYNFRAVAASLDVTAGAVVTLAGGASACDIFWTPGGATTIGAAASFQGTLVDDAVVTVGANATWTGRVLAFNGPVTAGASSTITVPTCAGTPATLHVIKQVINNSSGSALAASFNLHVKLSGAEVSGSPAVGVASPGTSYSLAANTYVVSEDTNVSYTQSFSGDCDSSGNITLAPGDNKSCTITNDDIAVGIPPPPPPPSPTSPPLPIPLSPATIRVTKTVINNNGQTKTPADFPLFVNTTPVTTGVTNVFAAPASYTVSETIDANYIRTFSGDCDLNGNINLVPGDNKLCVITNDDIAAPQITQPESSSGGSSVLPTAPQVDVTQPSPQILAANPILPPAGFGPTENATERNIPLACILIFASVCMILIAKKYAR